MAAAEEAQKKTKEEGDKVAEKTMKVAAAPAPAVATEAPAPAPASLAPRAK